MVGDPLDFWLLIKIFSTRLRSINHFIDHQLFITAGNFRHVWGTTLYDFYRIQIGTTALMKENHPEDLNRTKCNMLHGSNILHHINYGSYDILQATYYNGARQLISLQPHYIHWKTFLYIQYKIEFILPVYNGATSPERAPPAIKSHLFFSAFYSFYCLLKEDTWNLQGTADDYVIYPCSQSWNKYKVAGGKW